MPEKLCCLNWLNEACTFTPKKNVGFKMRRPGRAIPQVPSLCFRSIFFLFFMGTLACSLEPEVGSGGAELAGPERTETKEGPTAEPELFMLLSMENDSTAGLTQTQPMSLLADDSNSIDFEQVERIRQKPTTKSMALARANVDVFKENNIQISLSSTQKLRASKKHFETLNENTFIWAGKVSGVAAMSTFVVRNGNVTGSLRDENNVLYHIEPIGNGVHAVTEIDESRFPPNAEPLQAPAGDTLDSVYSVPVGVAATSATPVEIDILVAYTPAVRRARADIESLIHLAIEETHQTYRNSEIHIRLNLVDSFELDYTEHGNWYTMLSDFANSPTLHARRNASGADMSVLFIDHGAYCGMAYLYPTESSAVGLVWHACAVGRYVFGHELGHIQGAHHNEHIAENANWAFPYGYGYIYSVQGGANNFSTVMSYAFGAGCNYGCPYIPYWSNPNVRYNGIPTGTAAKNDNARVLNETAPRIAAYRARQDRVPTCSLYTPSTDIPSTGGIVSVSASCTHSPTSYVWTRDGVNPVSTGSTFNYFFPANRTSSALSFTIALVATNQIGESQPVQVVFHQPLGPPGPPDCALYTPSTNIPSTGGTMNVTATCSNSPTSYVWTLNGVRQAATGNVFNYALSANHDASTRSYTVAFLATNSAGESYPLEVVFRQPPGPPGCGLYTPSTNIPSTGGTMNVTATCTNSPTSYVWKLNGVRQAATGNVFNYALPANHDASTRSYTVAFLATNSVGESYPLEMVFRQPPGPPGCGLYTPTISIPSNGGTVNVTATCTNSPTSYVWTLNGVRQAAKGNVFSYSFPANTTSSTRSFAFGFIASNSVGESYPLEMVLHQPPRL